MINRWFVRPLLKVTTWIKRNPLLALILALILWLIPSPLTVLNWFTNWAVGVIGGVNSAFANAVGRGLTAFGNWLGAKSGRCYWVGLAVLPFSPLIGSSLMFWCSIQSLKPAPELKVVRPGGEDGTISTIPVPVVPDTTDNPFDFGWTN